MSTDIAAVRHPEKLNRAELLRLARAGADDGYDDSFHAQITTNKFILVEMRLVAEQARQELDKIQPEHFKKATS